MEEATTAVCVPHMDSAQPLAFLSDFLFFLSRGESWLATVLRGALLIARACKVENPRGPTKERCVSRRAVLARQSPIPSFRLYTQTHTLDPLITTCALLSLRCRSRTIHPWGIARRNAQYGRRGRTSGRSPHSWLKPPS